MVGALPRKPRRPPTRMSAGDGSFVPISVISGRTCRRPHDTAFGHVCPDPDGRSQQH
jgi:hypothetical protein